MEINNLEAFTVTFAIWNLAVATGHFQCFTFINSSIQIDFINIIPRWIFYPFKHGYENVIYKIISIRINYHRWRRSYLNEGVR